MVMLQGFFEARFWTNCNVAILYRNIKQEVQNVEKPKIKIDRTVSSTVVVRCFTMRSTHFYLTSNSVHT